MTAIPETSSESIGDSEVVQRVLTGETALFELLMRRYNQRVYRSVRAIVRDEHESEEVMQQAWVNAFEHLRKFEHRSSFATWLTRIAINQSLARVNPRGLRAHTAAGEDAMIDIPSGEPDPERQAAATQMRHLLEGEIAALPASHRTVLMLREVEGLSTAETAAILEVSEDVVKTRLHRARETLRDNLFRRAGGTFESLFTFGQSRCDRIVDVVLEQIGAR